LSIELNWDDCEVRELRHGGGVLAFIKVWQNGVPCSGSSTTAVVVTYDLNQAAKETDSSGGMEARRYPTTAGSLFLIAYARVYALD
jgi:hypothetical protein